MQSCFPSEFALFELGGDMALRNEDREWVTEQIGVAVGSVKPHGWKKAIHVLRELGPLSATIAIIVALLGITAASVYHAVADVQEEARFRTQTGDRLTQIENQLKLLPDQIKASALTSLPHNQLVAHRDELKQIKQKLANGDQTAPNFWPTSFQIITLLSQATTETESAAGQSEGVLDNVGSNPPGAIGPIKNGRVVLRNLVQGVTFENSIVRFDPSVRLVNDTFINCVFLFPTIQEPPKPLQEIGQALLASDLSRVTLNAS